MAGSPFFYKFGALKLTVGVSYRWLINLLKSELIYLCYEHTLVEN